MGSVNLLGLQCGIWTTYHRFWLVSSSVLGLSHSWPPRSRLSPLFLCKLSLSKAATGSGQEHGKVSKILLSQLAWAKVETKGKGQL